MRNGDADKSQITQAFPASSELCEKVSDKVREV